MRIRLNQGDVLLISSTSYYLYVFYYYIYLVEKWSSS